MPWNDNSNSGPKNPGPWGSPPPSGPDRPDDKPAPPASGGGGDRPPPKSPWGAGPSGGQGGGGGRGPAPRPRRPQGGGPTPPDFGDLSRRASEQFRRVFGGPGGAGINGRAVALTAGAVALLWVFSGVYVVQGNEQSVVTRFGEYVRTKGPGLGYHLPWPFERQIPVAVTSLKTTNIGGGDNVERPDESQMLTGDENIVDLDFSVQWRIRNPRDYLFNVADPEDTVKTVAESAMREVVGKTPLDPIISTGRGVVQAQVQELMQGTLDRYGTGVQVVEVQIRNANPPEEVIAAFREVASAGQERESLVNEANAYRNRVVNEAKGDASRIRQAAEGYRERVTREAEGSAARFNQVYAEYQAAPGVTRDRIYLETMERVLGRSNKVIVDGNGATAPIILPPEIFRQGQRRASGSETGPDAPAATPAPATAVQESSR